MVRYTQTNRPLAITTPLGPDALLLTGFSGVESFSEPFYFQLELLAEAPVSFEGVLGKPASIRLDTPGCPRRYVHGLITRLWQGGWQGGPEGRHTFLRYQAELRPYLWLLGKRVRSRVFQQMAVPDILHAVFHDGWGVVVEEVVLQLSGSYLPRDYCVQYQESDLAFVSRLMEEEGIYYFFKHAEDKHTLVLVDSVTALPDLGELVYDDGSGGLRGANGGTSWSSSLDHRTRPQEDVPGSKTTTFPPFDEGLRVTSWSKSQEVTGCAYAVQDYCFEMPPSTLEAQSDILEQVPVGQKTHHLAPQTSESSLLRTDEYPGGYGWRFDGVDRAGSPQPDQLQHLFSENQRLAQLGMEEEAARALLIEGESPCGHLLPGSQFSLKGHFDGDGSYYLSRVEHEVQMESAYVEDSSETLSCLAVFQALPALLPYRPKRLTPRPRIEGIQTATVVGSDDQNVFVDPYGRVKVKFHWDPRKEADAESSCWLRVGQLWAGNQWGAFFWPRVGHEVMVAFEQGNPDRPLVVGSVYNARNMPPFELPAQRLRAGIKSFRAGMLPNIPSTPLEHFNGFVIDDTPGEEKLELHGQQHIQFNSESTHLQNITGEHRVNVSDTHSIHVGMMGSGSGGGGGSGPDSTDLTDGKDTSVFQYTMPPYVLDHGPGIAFSSTCGISAQAVVGQQTLLVNGSRLYVCINPTSFFTEVAGLGSNPVANTISALCNAAGGEVQMFYGNKLALNYARTMTINRATRAHITNSKNYRDSPAEVALATTIATLATAGMIEAVKNAYSTDAKVWESLLGTAGSLSAVQGLVETYLAYSEQAARAAEATAAALVAKDALAMSNLANSLDSMVQSISSGFNKAASTKGAVLEYSDYNITGVSDGMLLFAGTVANEQSTMAMGAQNIQLALGIPQIGPRIEMTEQSIALKVGPDAAGAAVTVSMSGIKLSLFGMFTLEINNEGIHLAVPGNTDDLTANGRTQDVINSDMRVQLNHALQALNLGVNVEGELQQEVGIEMAD